VTIIDLDDNMEEDGETYFTDLSNMTFPGLFPYTTYGFLLSASTVVGKGPDSDLHTVQTQEEG
jgi:hypothetical protein